MKKTILFISAILFSASVFAQDAVPDSLAGWKTGGVVSINASQVSLTNWAAGGESSVSGSGLFSAFVNYRKNKFTWENTLDIAYGLIKQGEDPVIKSDDKISFASKSGLSAFGDWYYTGLVGFQTQFDRGYDNPGDELYISDFMAPAYLNVSIGLDYKPSDMFSLYLSPLSGKFTVVADDSLAAQGAYGVGPGKQLRPEFGGYLKMMFKYDIMKNVNFQTTLDLFSNYLNNPENIDVNWDVLISMKINEYLSANLTTTLIYDDDIMIAFENGDGSVDKRPAVQFKEVFGVGFSYKF
ncbi:MAG: DUF3078 domain-containing protein [Bacteroidota bacterium]